MANTTVEEKRRKRAEAREAVKRDALLERLKEFDSQNKTIIIMLANLNSALVALRTYLGARFDQLAKQQHKVAQAVLNPPDVAPPSVPKPFFKVDQ